MTVDLVVIEAPGKLQTFRAALRGLRGEYQVIATKGHFCHMPDSLTPLGIDRRFHETLRTADAGGARRLTDAGQRARRVYLATDDDDEGHVIAADCARLLPGKELYRALIHDLAPDTIRRAIGEAAQFAFGPDVPGTARRIVDRLIGGVFSRPGVGCGRVLSPLLERAAGGVAQPSATRAAGPWNCGDALLAGQAELGMSISAATAVMQRLYERGLVSYPRTSSRSFAPATIVAIKRFGSDHGVPPTVDIPARSPDRAEPHEGLHPTRAGFAEVMLAGDLRRRPDDEALLSLIARSVVETARGDDVPWKRAGGRLGADGLVVAALMEAGLGRPSTYAKHAADAVERRLVAVRDARLGLTTIGARWREAAPAWLRAAEFSRRTENVISDLSRRALSAPAVVQQLVASWPVAAQAPVLEALEPVEGEGREAEAEPGLRRSLA